MDTCVWEQTYKNNLIVKISTVKVQNFDHLFPAYVPHNRNIGRGDAHTLSWKWNTEYLSPSYICSWIAVRTNVQYFYNHNLFHRWKFQNTLLIWYFDTYLVIDNYMILTKPHTIQSIYRLTNDWMMITTNHADRMKLNSNYNSRILVAKTIVCRFLFIGKKT